MTLEGWRVLRAGHGPDVVLGVDFTQAKVRAQATFTDLAQALPGAYPVWGTDETGWPAADGDPAAQLQAWVEHGLGMLAAPGATGRGTGAPAASGPAATGPAGTGPAGTGPAGTGPGVVGRVRGVLGFCAGSGPACALARRLAQVQEVAPRLVLFNPAVVGAATLLDQFDTSLTSMAAMAGPDELRAARDGARADAEAACGPAGAGGPAGLARLAARLVDRYAAVARPVCRSRGVPAAIADQLCARVGVHLRYLALCAASGDLTGPVGDDPAGDDPAGGALVVHSADHVVPPGVGIRRRLRLDTTHASLLGDPGAVLAAAGELDGAPVAGRA